METATLWLAWEDCSVVSVRAAASFATLSAEPVMVFIRLRMLEPRLPMECIIAPISSWRATQSGLIGSLR